MKKMLKPDMKTFLVVLPFQIRSQLIAIHALYAVKYRADYQARHHSEISYIHANDQMAQYA